jgi:WD40 repeat protein
VRCWTTKSSYLAKWLTPQLILFDAFSSGGEVFDISRADCSPVLADVGSSFFSKQLSPDKALFAFEDQSSSAAPLGSKSERTVIIWDVAKRAPRCTLKAGSSDYYLTPSWSPDSRFLAGDRNEKEGEIDWGKSYWGTPTTKTTRIWDAHSCELLNSASFSHSGFACTEVDWKTMRPGKPCRSVSADGKYYQEYGSSEIRKASDDSASAHFEGTFLKWGPRPLEFSFVSPPNLIRLASPVAAAPLGELTLPFGIINQFAEVSPDGKMFGIRVYDSEETVYVWNAESNRITAKLSGHIIPMWFEGNGSLLVTASDGSFGLVDTASGRQLAKIQKSPVFSPDAQYVAGIPQDGAASENSVVWVWRIRRRWW